MTNNNPTSFSDDKYTGSVTYNNDGSVNTWVCSDASGTSVITQNDDGSYSYSRY